MWLLKIEDGADGYNAGWIDRRVTFVIVPLDVLEIYGVANNRQSASVIRDPHRNR